MTMASSSDNTHKEQGLNPSTRAMSEVVTTRGWALKLTVPMSGNVRVFSVGVLVADVADVADVVVGVVGVDDGWLEPSAR